MSLILDQAEGNLPTGRSKQFIFQMLLQHSVSRLGCLCAGTCYRVACDEHVPRIHQFLFDQIAIQHSKKTDPSRPRGICAGTKSINVAMSTPQIGTITLSESLAPDYMVNRLYKQSTMGDLKTEYSPQLDLCVPQDMTISFAVPETEEMKREKDVFEETITKYRQSKAAQQAGATKPTGKQDWNWQDVFEEMDSADKRYRDLDTDGVLGRLRQTIRKFGKFKEPAEGWMRLLPSDSWQGSLVCGGLKMVLNVGPPICFQSSGRTDSKERQRGTWARFGRR